MLPCAHDAKICRDSAFNNDIVVELASGGDPPIPQSLAAEAEFDQEAAGKGGRNGMAFAIEADGLFIGQCALFNVNPTAQTCELGITVMIRHIGAQASRDSAAAALRLPLSEYAGVAERNGRQTAQRLTVRVVSWKRGVSAPTCGATAAMMTWCSWGFYARSGSTPGR